MLCNKLTEVMMNIENDVKNVVDQVYRVKC